MASADHTKIAKTYANIYALICFGLILVCLSLVYTLHTRQDHFTLDVPPMITEGVIVSPGEYRKSTVHAFASMVFRSLNNWPDDGLIDYKANIDSRKSFLTQRFVDYLYEDLRLRNSDNELAGRTRSMDVIHGTDMHTPDASFVEVIDDETWIVNLPMQLEERISAFQVKESRIEYWVVVRVSGEKAEDNPWGLLLDGYPKGQLPKRHNENIVNTEELL